MHGFRNMILCGDALVLCCTLHVHFFALQMKAKVTAFFLPLFIARLHRSSSRYSVQWSAYIGSLHT